MAKLDQIDALAATHESELKEALADAYSELLAGFPLNIVSSSLDDIDPDHIRDQLYQIPLIRTHVPTGAIRWT